MQHCRYKWINSENCRPVQIGSICRYGKIIVIQKLKFRLENVENIVGKGESAGH